MTVEQLIKELQKFPKDEEVLLVNREHPELFRKEDETPLTIIGIEYDDVFAGVYVVGRDENLED